MNKRDLRQIYLEKRLTLSSENVMIASRKICENLFENFDFEKVNFLHCFLSIVKFNEIDTSLIFEKIWKDFPRVKAFAPRINRKKDLLESVEFTAQTNLVKNSWGISEPVKVETFEADLIDAVLVPLLCFDRRGFRVGYGKGFYDKFLKNCRADCLKIGLSQFPPAEKIEDVDSFDVRLDFCITPEKIYDWQQRSAG